MLIGEILFGGEKSESTIIFEKNQRIEMKDVCKEIVDKIRKQIAEMYKIFFLNDKNNFCF